MRRRDDLRDGGDDEAAPLRDRAVGSGERGLASAACRAAEIRPSTQAETQRPTLLGIAVQVLVRVEGRFGPGPAGYSHWLAED